jgi:ArsR family metal-binding transcriptional regulator
MEISTMELKVVKGEAFIAIYENGIVTDNLITHITEGSEANLALKIGTGFIAKATEEEVLSEIKRLKLKYEPIV